MDRGAWRATVRGVPKSQTRLSDQAQGRELRSHTLHGAAKKKEAVLNNVMWNLSALNFLVL